MSLFKSQHKIKESSNSLGFSRPTAQKQFIFGNASSISVPYNQILVQIINLPAKHLNLLECIFLGRKRHRKMFYSLTTLGDRVGYERSWTGRIAHELRDMGLLKIYGRYWNTHIWELGSVFEDRGLYASLHDFFMGFGLKDLLSKVPAIRENPLLNKIKKRTKKEGALADDYLGDSSSLVRGRSPRNDFAPTRKRNFVEYLDQWSEARWISLQKVIGEPNKPMSEALAQEIFG